MVPPGYVLSEETKRKMREAWIRRKVHPNYRPPCLGKRWKVSTNRPVRILSREHRKKLSISRLRYFRNGGTISHKSSRTRQGHRDDLGYSVRSSWEANIARFLILNEIEYQYEPKRFNLGYTTYLPDFYLPFLDIYLEIKGYDSSEAKRKRICTRRKYGVRIIVIKKKQYDKIMDIVSQYDDYYGLQFE